MERDKPLVDLANISLEYIRYPIIPLSLGAVKGYFEVNSYYFIP